MKILGIETSCDETSASVLEVSNNLFTVKSNIISSSQDLQAKYGGIVPEVAARKQIEYIIPVVKEALLDIQPEQVDAVAVTIGPGLATSLQTGIDTAKALAYAWQKPLIPVNHLEGHLYSPLLADEPSENVIQFPAIGLIVSGGHTELILVNNFLNYKLLGRTRDDAVGETLDKVGRLFDLPYPGGATIGRLAPTGNPTTYDFPRPMIDSDDYDFSFSGLKTAILYASKKDESMKSEENLPHFAASFDKAIVDVLSHKLAKAIKNTRPKTVLMGGGVTANPSLRNQIQKICDDNSVSCLIAKKGFTGDNAAMIAAAGYFRYQQNYYINPIPADNKWQSIKASPNFKLI